MKNTTGLDRTGNPGHKGGSGRPKKEFTEFCKKLIKSPKAQKFLKAMIEGEPIEERILDTPGGEPQTILVAAKPGDRLKAIELVAAYAEGKPLQGIEHSGTIDVNAEDARRKIQEETKAYLRGMLGQ